MNGASFSGGFSWASACLYVYVACVLGFLIAPSMIVVPMSFSGASSLEFPPESWSLRWYREYFGTVEWMDATAISLSAASLTMVLATTLGTAAAYGLHQSTGRWVRWAQVGFALPMIVPLILLGIGLFFIFARLGLVNTLTGLVIAHTALAIPFVVVTVSAGLKNYDMNQEMVARSLGANHARAFFLITLPQIRFSVLSGALFAFIISLDEVVIALFISGGDRATLTRRMFNALRDEIDPTIAAISTCLISLSIVAVLLGQYLQGRRDASAAPR